MPLRHWFIGTLLAATAAPALSAEAVLVDEMLSEATLAAAGSEGVSLNVDGEQRVASWGRLVRWGAPAEPPRRPVVVLRDGSEIVAAPPWTRDGSVRLAGDGLSIQSTTTRAVVPRAAVETVWFEGAKDAEIKHAVLTSGDERDTAEDRVWLVDGDVLTGELTAIGGGVATLALGGESVDIELSRVAAVRLAGKNPPRTASLIVGLKDGSLLRAASCTAEEKRLEIELVGGVKLTRRKGSAVVFLQLLTGVTYLSDLTPLDYRHTPYAGVAWPLARDANLLGEPLHAGGQRFLKGLAMHSPSRVVYRLTPGEHTRLDFAMAIDDAAAPAGGGAGQGGSVVFRVLLAREEGFEPAFTSDIVRSGDAPQPASVDIAGARAIALVVEPADFGDRLDHAVWLDARLVRRSDKR